VERYAEHYARVNPTIAPAEVEKRQYLTMQMMYGDLVTSLPVGSRVLDLGCGTGILLQWLSKQPGIIAAGVDSSLTQVQIAKQSLEEIEVSCENGLDHLGRHLDTFAGIFCLDVLEHLETEDLCLKWVEMSRSSLKSGGFFCCKVPNAANLTGSYSRYMDFTHRRLFTSTSLIQLLEAGGFQDSRLISIRAADIRGRLRLAMETLLHRIIFIICGHGLERNFSSNVCAVGFKRGGTKG
jgi:cyclopropane fatty-acyl-phospholipid synthase-like methyltransferase